MNSCSANFRIYPVNVNPLGVPYSQWILKWWQWILAIPKWCNPATDSTGAHASIGQLDDAVFFLCQTMEGVKPFPSRRIRIPSGKSIFMPILNWVSILHEDGESDEELKFQAKKRMDLVGHLGVTVNGRRLEGLEKHRFQSAIFEIFLEQNNLLDLKPGMIRLVSDGFWLFSEPLFNNVEMTSFGSCSSGATQISVKYLIEVN
jgi:hypothetical protein